MPSMCDNDVTQVAVSDGVCRSAQREVVDRRKDAHLSSMVLGLIEDSYLSAGTLTEFAAEILEVLAYAATVPVAFTKGFLRSYLSVERIVAEDDGRITIIPRKTAALEDVVSDADAILARVDGQAVFNPVVQARLSGAHQISRATMRWGPDELAAMDDTELAEALRTMEADSERQRTETRERREAMTDHLRARFASVTPNLQALAPRDS